MSGAVPRRAAAALAAVLLTLLLVGLSRVPFTWVRSEDAQLRLAWQYHSQPVSRCRTATDAELQRLPEHMRQRTICERALRPYRLRVTVDGVVRSDDTVHARGARADRPLGVFRQLALAPGRHAVAVAFTPLALPADSAGAPPPAPTALDTTLTFSPREVWLGTLDEERGALVLRNRLVP